VTVRTPAALAVLAAVLLFTAAVGGCGSPGVLASSPSAPLGGDGLPGTLCWPSRAGQIVYYGGNIAVNSSSHPVRITRVWLTGTRELTTHAVYAEAYDTGSAPVSVIGFGWPAQLFAPRQYQRPAVGAVIPAEGTAQIVVVVTVRGSSAFANGEDLTYSSQGQSWFQANPHDLQLGHGPCV
jgi:hypothetical protein